jgi:hypothetical protein
MTIKTMEYNTLSQPDSPAPYKVRIDGQFINSLLQKNAAQTQAITALHKEIIHLQNEFNVLATDFAEMEKKIKGLVKVDITS